jgi:hypothetical protein
LKCGTAENFKDTSAVFFYGDADRGEPLIYRWRLNPSSEQEFDYDKTIIPDLGILILQEEIVSVIPAQ